MPWMMCENVYQSVRCCEFSELWTTPCQSLMYPHLQIGTRPIENRIAAVAAMIVADRTVEATRGRRNQYMDVGNRSIARLVRVLGSWARPDEVRGEAWDGY